jgi:hypothetical protein
MDMEWCKIQTPNDWIRMVLFMGLTKKMEHYLDKKITAQIPWPKGIPLFISEAKRIFNRILIAKQYYYEYHTFATTLYFNLNIAMDFQMNTIPVMFPYY